MKTRFLRFFALMTVCVLGMAVWSCGDDDDKDTVIGYDTLPAQAQTFISTYSTRPACGRMSTLLRGRQSPRVSSRQRWPCMSTPATPAWASMRSHATRAAMRLILSTAPTCFSTPPATSSASTADIISDWIFRNRAI